jgi:hypothetical protein
VNDDNQLFGGFTPSPPPDPSAAGKKPRKKRGARRSTITGIVAGGSTGTVTPITAGSDNNVSNVSIGTRPKRARKTGTPRPTVIPIGILPVLAGLKEDDATVLMSVVDSLQCASKKSRGRIVAALAKIFA